MELRRRNNTVVYLLEAILWGESRRCRCLIASASLSRCRLDRSPCQGCLWLIFPPSATLQVRYMPLVEVLQVQRNGGFSYLKQNCSEQSSYNCFQKMLYTLFVHTCFYSSLIKVRLFILKKSGLIPDLVIIWAYIAKDLRALP